MTPRLNQRQEAIGIELHIHHARLEQLEDPHVPLLPNPLIPLPRLRDPFFTPIPPPDLTHRQIHLRIAQRHAETLPAPARKAHEILIQRPIQPPLPIQPALGPVLARPREDRLVVVQLRIRHPDRRPRRDRPRPARRRVAQPQLLLGDARQPPRHPVRQPQRLLDHRVQERQRLHVRERHDGVRVRDRGAQLGLEPAQQSRRPDEVEGADLEDPGGRQRAGHHEHLRLVREAGEGFVGLGELGVQDLVEDGGVRELRVHGVGARLDLGDLLRRVLRVLDGERCEKGGGRGEMRENYPFLRNEGGHGGMG